MKRPPLSFLLWWLCHAQAYDICDMPALNDLPPSGTLEAHMEQPPLVPKGAQTCSMMVKASRPVSVVSVTGVMFNLESCSQAKLETCNSNFVLVNDRKVCECRSLEDSWPSQLVRVLHVTFNRTSANAASFKLTYRVQSCDVSELSKSSHQVADTNFYDSADVKCLGQALIYDTASGKLTNGAIARCNFSSESWERVPVCKLDLNVNEETSSIEGNATQMVPESQEIHAPSHHSFADDHHESDFPKELVGGLAFVLVICVGVIIGATIYNVKRRYKFSIMRRPSRNKQVSMAISQARADRQQSLLRARGDGVNAAVEDNSCAADRLLYERSYAVPIDENEYAVPFDPALGQRSHTSAGNEALPLKQFEGSHTDQAVEYHVLEGDSPAAT